MASETAVKRKEGEVRRAEPTRAGRIYTPPVDIYEKDDGLLLLLDMPGVEPGNLDIQYENGMLTIHGRVDAQQPENANYVRREFGKGDYHRTFSVGEGIDIDKIEAEYKDGVVQLKLPKSESLKPHRIEVKA